MYKLIYICLTAMCVLMYGNFYLQRKAENVVQNKADLLKNNWMIINKQKISDFTQEQRTMLTLLSEPRFVGEDFLYKLTKQKAKVKGVNIENGDIYFSLSKKYVKANEDLTSLAVDPAKVCIGKNQEGELTLDKNSKTPLAIDRYSWEYFNDYFLRINIVNLKYNSQKKLIYQIGNYIYDIFLSELNDFVNNKRTYGGQITIEISRSDKIVKKVFNHSIVIAKKGEPSLNRLIHRIVNQNDSNEVKTQKLLNFVTEDIKYSREEALNDVETLKRPSEVLITGKSDCSGKVILYASLLEQLEIDYAILYLGENSLNHITIAVDGDFSKQNRLNCVVEGKKYFLAETTVPGFIIGESFLSKKMSYNNIFIQLPSYQFSVFNGKSGEKIF